MAVILDAATDGSTFGGATSKSFSHTVGTGYANTVLFAMISMVHEGGAAANAPTVTYNGVSMTKHNHYSQTAGPDKTVAIYYLVAPATGSNTVAFSWTNNATGKAGAISFFGVNQQTPVRPNSWQTDNTNGSPSISVPSKTGDYVLDVVGVTDTFGGSGGSLTVGSGQTAIFNGPAQLGERINAGASYELASDGTTTMSWTETLADTSPALAGLCVQAASIVGGAVISPTMIF